MKFRIFMNKIKKNLLLKQKFFPLLNTIITSTLLLIFYIFLYILFILYNSASLNFLQMYKNSQFDKYYIYNDKYYIFICISLQINEIIHVWINIHNIQNFGSQTKTNKMKSSDIFAFFFSSQLFGIFYNIRSNNK